MVDIIKALYPLAPYGLIVSGLVAAGLHLPDIAWAGCITAGLALVNPQH